MEEKHATNSEHIKNAGMVILWPFIGKLFERLAYTEADKFKNEELRERAVLLLEFLVSGNKDFEGETLALNKLLCGMFVGKVIGQLIEPTDAEKEACESLLEAVKNSWEKMRETSIARLRETFLLRDGQLDILEDKNGLKVIRGSLDVLVDTLPWSISPIKLPWMARAVYVRW